MPARILRSRFLLVAAGVGCLLWFTLLGNLPARRVAQINLQTDDGVTGTLKLLRAPAFVRLPMWRSGSVYVQWNNEKRYLLHRGFFCSSVRYVWVSRSTCRAFVERSFEGGVRSGLLFDLSTGDARQLHGVHIEGEFSGWACYDWRGRAVKKKDGH